MTAPAKLTKAGFRILESARDNDATGGHPIRDQGELRRVTALKDAGYATLAWSTSSPTVYGNAKITAAGLARLESEKGKRA